MAGITISVHKHTKEEKALLRLFESLEQKNNILFPRGFYTLRATEILCRSGIVKGAKEAALLLQKLVRRGFVSRHRVPMGTKAQVNVGWNPSGIAAAEQLISEAKEAKDARHEARIDRSKITYNLSREEQLARRAAHTGEIFVDLDNIAIPLINAGIEFSEIALRIVRGLRGVAAGEGVASPDFCFVTCEGFLAKEIFFRSWLDGLSSLPGFRYEVVPTGKDAADKVIERRAREAGMNTNLDHIFIASGDWYFENTIFELHRIGKHITLIPFSPSNKNECYRLLESQLPRFHVKYLERFLMKNFSENIANTAS